MKIKLYHQLSNNKTINLSQSCVIISLSFFIVSFLHSIFLVESDFIDNLVLLLCYLPVLVFSFFVVRRNIKLRFPDPNWLIFFWFAGIIGKSISRLGYINGLIEFGSVYSVRSMDSFSQGGWYSFLSVFFYPAFMLIIISSIKYKFNIIIYISAFLFLLIDLAFLSMRMVPVYILFIAMIVAFSRVTIFQSFKKIVVFIIIFVPLFMVTTQNKSAYGDMLNWNSHLRHTISTEVIPIKEDVLNIDKPPILSAGIFLSHYLYHSIGEFSNYIKSDYLNILELNVLRLKDQFCPILKCDYESQIRSIDKRYGVYKTFHYSMISDFGLACYIVISALIFVFILMFFLMKTYSAVHFVLIPVILLSPIENFLYTGLGLIQFGMVIFIVLLSKVFSHVTNKIGSKNEKVIN